MCQITERIPEAYKKDCARLNVRPFPLNQAPRLTNLTGMPSASSRHTTARLSALDSMRHTGSNPCIRKFASGQLGTVEKLADTGYFSG